MAGQFLAAAAQALPMLMGGSGGSTEVSNSLSNNLTNAINPVIGVTLGGGVQAFPVGTPTNNAPTTAYAMSTPNGGALPFSGGEPIYPDVRYTSPTSGAVSMGGGMDNGLILIGLAVAAGFLLLKGK